MSRIAVKNRPAPPAVARTVLAAPLTLRRVRLKNPRLLRLPRKVAKRPRSGSRSGPGAAPAPAEPEAYFPSRLKNQQSKVRKNGLSNLFGLRG